MGDRPFAVVASSGDLKPDGTDGVGFAHPWTAEGVVVETDFTGGHLLHLAIAGCVLNDVHREAEKLDIPVDGVKVEAWGDFDRETWQSTGVAYRVEISSPAPSDDVDRLIAQVDEVAEIPKAVRSPARVERI